jgi:FtsP/CotA-like multicopper oxidase with cupredoxin domain
MLALHSRVRSRALLSGLSLLGASCGAPLGAEQEAPAHREVGLPEAADLDPNPNVVAVELTAAPADVEILPGQRSRLAAYSNHFPGPLIRGKRGDRLKVHFDNRLDAETTVHFHGIRLPNAMDGVPDMTQPAVAPGGAFDYEFDLDDPGLYWYHPHCDTVAQMGSGLYGAVLVDDPDEPEELGDETVLVLSDVSIDDQGNLLPVVTGGAAVITGSEGNVVLVNGQVYPTLDVERGRRQRFRVLNASRARYFRLAIPGHTFLKIGTGPGRTEQPALVEEPVLAAGERLDLVLEPFDEATSSVELVSRSISRGLPLAPSPEVPLMKLRVVPSDSAASAPLPDTGRAIAAIDTAGAGEVPIALTMAEAGDSFVMGINGVHGSEAQPIHGKLGSTHVLVVENITPYAHPFHLHGFFFQPLDVDGNIIHPIELRDTIDIPPVRSVKLAVHLDERPGMWMFHCHILDHADAGMMGMFHVAP